jgi:hypothetical protein
MIQYKIVELPRNTQGQLLYQLFANKKLLMTDEYPVVHDKMKTLIRPGDTVDDIGHVYTYEVVQEQMRRDVLFLRGDL